MRCALDHLPSRVTESVRRVFDFGPVELAADVEDRRTHVLQLEGTRARLLVELVGATLHLEDAPPQVFRYVRLLTSRSHEPAANHQRGRLVEASCVVLRLLV